MCATTSAVQIDELFVELSDHFCLDVPNLVVPERTSLGILGLNGSGKSTLLEAILGVKQITNGVVHIFGINSTIYRRHAQHRLRLGAVLEGAQLPSHLTVNEVVRLHKMVYGAVDSDVYDALGIGSFSKQRVARLSKGQYQRTLLYCAMAHGPHVLILDEGSNGLDGAHTRSMHELIFGSWGRMRTIIMSSHHDEELSRVDAVALLEKGKLISKKTPEALVRSLSWCWRFVLPDSTFCHMRADFRSLEGYVANYLCREGMRAVVGNDKFARQAYSYISNNPPNYLRVEQVSIHDALINETTFEY